MKKDKDADEAIRKVTRHRTLLRHLEEDRRLMKKAGHKMDGIDRHVDCARTAFCDYLITAAKICMEAGDRTTALRLSKEYARERRSR